MQSQKAVTAYFKTKQLLHFYFAQQHAVVRGHTPHRGLIKTSPTPNVECNKNKNAFLIYYSWMELTNRYNNLSCIKFYKLSDNKVSSNLHWALKNA